MLQYVQSEIPIFGQFCTHVFGQILYTLGSDLGPSSRLRMHHGLDIAANKLGRVKVHWRYLSPAALPCPHLHSHQPGVVTTYIFVHLRATDQRSRLFLDRTSPRFSSFCTQFWIGHTAKFGVKSVHIGIGHTAAYSWGLFESIQPLCCTVPFWTVNNQVTSWLWSKCI